MKDEWSNPTNEDESQQGQNSLTESQSPAVRCHGAFLNGYDADDEGLYDAAPSH